MTGIYTSDYNLHGVHRDRVRSLVNYKFFPAYVNVFWIAPVIGFLFKKKSPLNKDDKAAAKIQISQLIAHEVRIEQVIRMIVLNDPTLELTLEERVDALFRNQTIPPKALQSFEDYLRGGIDILYEELIDNALDEQNATLRVRDLLSEIDMESIGATRENILKACPTIK